MKKLMLLCAILMVAGCQTSQTNPDPKLYANKGVVVSEPACQDGVCHAVIKVDDDVWNYAPIKAPVKRGDTLYHTCRYEPTREVCSALWARKPYAFYSSVNGQ